MTPMQPRDGTARSQHPEVSQRETERTILALLLSEPHAWNSTEIGRELGGQSIASQDAIDGLVRAGLLNREGDLILASRAARAFEELEP